MSLSAVRAILDDAVAAGVPEPEALQRLRLSPTAFARPEGRVPAYRVHGLIEDMLEVGGQDAYLGAWAQRRLGEFGPLGLLAATCADMETCLRRLCSFLPVVSTDVDYRLTRDRQGVHLIVESPCSPRAGVYARVTGVLGVVMALAHPLSGGGWRPSQVRLPGPDLPDTPLRRELFGDRVSYGAEAGEVVVDPSVLALPLLRSAPAVTEFFEQELRAPLQHHGEPGSVASKVRSVVVTCIAEGPTLAATAREMGVSSRTLQRRLAEQGTTFHAVVDGIRQDLGKYYLYEGAAIGEVSLALGFSEPSAFHRAFKRWTGRTPVQWRSHHVA